MRAAETWTAVMLTAALILTPFQSVRAQEGQKVHPRQTEADSQAGWEEPQTPPAGSTGRREPSPEEVQRMMQSIMGPMMGQMMSGMIKAMAQTLSDPEIAEHLATFTRNFYDALRARGFSEEEAMRIVTCAGWPRVRGMQQ